jgi:hypothetical protein
VIKQNGGLISCDGWGRVRFPDWNGNTNYLAYIDHHLGKSYCASGEKCLKSRHIQKENCFKSLERPTWTKFLLQLVEFMLAKL